MKKMVKAALAAALVCFSSSLFAAEPVSFLKGTTFGLFEDETVDNLAWGVEDADGLVLGGFNSANFEFNVGAGAWLGDFWYSIYDTGSFYTERVKTETVENNAVAKDGYNTDYVNKDKSSVKERWTHNPSLDDPTDPDYYDYHDELYNDLYLSFSTGDWGIQAYWLFRDETASDKNPYGKSTDYTEDKATGQTHTEEYVVNPSSGSNTFGAYFSGIETDSDFYFKLNQFQVAWAHQGEKGKYSDTWKQNGVTYTGGDDGSYTYNTKNAKSVWSWNGISPYISGEMGFALPDLGSLSTKLVFEEAFNMNITFSKYEESSNYVREDVNEKVTTKTSNNYNDKAYISWQNTLTPKFVFDFDVGERLNVKAKAALGIGVGGGTNNRPSTYTSITESTTYNKYNKTTTKTYSKTVALSGGGGQLEKEFITSLYPTTDLALVYQVKPGKFNLNLGAEWNVGTFSWDTVTKTNQAVKTSTYVENTNSAGVKTVTTDSVTYVNKGDSADGSVTPETRVTTFTASPSAETILKVGATWFITEKASLDIAYTGAFEDVRIMDDLLNSSLKLMFSVKF